LSFGVDSSFLTLSLSVTRVLIVRSAVPAIFCAGADLRERRSMSDTDVSRFLYDLRGVASDLERLPMPTIAAVDGAAVGGGLELALCCDFRIAGWVASCLQMPRSCSCMNGYELGASVKKLGLPETGLAIIPGCASPLCLPLSRDGIVDFGDSAGGTQRLPRLIGTSKAKDLIFTSRLIDAQEALRIGWYLFFSYAISFYSFDSSPGLINYVAEEGESATDRARRFAQQIIPNGALSSFVRWVMAREVNSWRHTIGPLGVRAAKLAIDKGIGIDLCVCVSRLSPNSILLTFARGMNSEAGLDLERQAYAPLLFSKDRLEGLAAFAEKRKPVYKGE
jgi:methylglutaconyl-CoA hydratase